MQIGFRREEDLQGGGGLQGGGLHGGGLQEGEPGLEGDLIFAKIFFNPLFVLQGAGTEGHRVGSRTQHGSGAPGQGFFGAFGHDGE